MKLFCGDNNISFGEAGRQGKHSVLQSWSRNVLSVSTVLT